MAGEPDYDSIGEANSEINSGRFLTETQRKCLLGKYDAPSDNAEYQMRSKIRSRTKGALHELRFIGDNLSKQDRKLLYEMETPSSTELDEMPEINGKRVPSPTDQSSIYGLWGNVGLSRIMQSILTLYYKTLREQEISAERLCQHIEYAIETAESEYGDEYREVTATVEIESTERIDIEAAKRKLEEQGSKAVSGTEMKALADEGYIRTEVVPDEGTEEN